MQIYHSLKNNYCCPACGGYTELPHGQGLRCYGFTNDNKYIYCTREEHGGNAPQSDWGAYIHFNDDNCKCGIPHNRPSNSVVTPEKILYKPASNTKTKELAIEYWNNSIEITGTYAEQWFNSRGINLDKIPEDSQFHSLIDVDFLLKQIRFNINVYCSELELYCNALIGAVKNNDRSIIEGINLTYLDGWSKIPELEKPRVSMGDIKGNGIYLAPPHEVMGITEGIEDGLAVQHLFGLPTIATTGAGFVPSVDLPDIVKEIHICTDGDFAGGVAVKQSQKRYGDLGLKVVNRQAPYYLDVKDWNDVLMKKIKEEQNG